MLHLEMRPGSVIPAHTHEGVAEVLYIIEGDFINEGKRHQPGTSLHVKAGKSHGPHPHREGLQDSRALVGQSRDTGCES